MAQLAPSLVALRDEVNRRWPGRDTGSDGWIGDAAHQARPSDHNPGDRGLVHALDVDEDVDGTDDEAGAELAALVEHWRARRDPRIKYVIYEGRLFASYHRDHRAAWAWGPYSGANAHRRHVHVSILSTIPAETDTRPWLPQQEDDAMTPEQQKWLAGQLDLIRGKVETTYNQVNIRTGALSTKLNTVLGELRAGVAIDEGELAAAVLEGLTVDKIAAAIPAGIAGDVVDALAARLGRPVP